MQIIKLICFGLCASNTVSSYTCQNLTSRLEALVVGCRLSWRPFCRTKWKNLNRIDPSAAVRRANNCALGNVTVINISDFRCFNGKSFTIGGYSHNDDKEHPRQCDHRIIKKSASRVARKNSHSIINMVSHSVTVTKSAVTTTEFSDLSAYMMVFCKQVSWSTFSSTILVIWLLEFEILMCYRVIDTCHISLYLKNWLLIVWKQWTAKKWIPY